SVPPVSALRACTSSLLGLLAMLSLFGSLVVAPAVPVSAAAPFAFDDADCGPPSTTIPGPPPNLIVVGQAMKDCWLMCYMRQDIEGQTFSFDKWGDVRKASFRGYPVECWTPEVDPAAGGRQTNGIVAELYGWNLDHTQYVRFTYR